MSNKFPLKLMSILDSHEHQDIISWLPHGRGFIIRDKKRLADLVLPKYFKESKYTSFTRRLNRWNFTIQTHGHKEASYFHPMFIQGDPQRVLEMHPVPQSAKAKRESRYIDDRRRMELGLNFAGSGTMNSAVRTSSMGQVMGNYELSNASKMQTHNNNAHPAMDYGAPMNMAGPIEYSRRNSFSAKGPFMPSPHYMQMQSSNNPAAGIPMNLHMQTTMQTYPSFTNHQSLQAQFHANGPMMHPGSHPGTNLAGNVTGGMHPSTYFQHHPTGANTSAQGNMMQPGFGDTEPPFQHSTSFSNHGSMLMQSSGAPSADYYQPPTSTNSSNRTVAQGQFNGSMMQGQPNGPMVVQGQPNGPMMQGHPTSFMMHQNGIGMQSHNTFGEYPPNQHNPSYAPFPGRYEAPTSYPTSQYMNNASGIIPHAGHAASYPTSSSNNVASTLESSNFLVENNVTSDIRTKGRKGAKLKSKKSSINSTTSKKDEQQGTKEEEGGSNSLSRTESTSVSTNINHLGSHEDFKDDSSNKFDKQPENSEHEKQSSPSHTIDDSNSNENTIDSYAKNSGKHHGDSSSPEPPMKRIKDC